MPLKIFPLLAGQRKNPDLQEALNYAKYKQFFLFLNSHACSSWVVAFQIQQTDEAFFTMGCTGPSCALHEARSSGEKKSLCDHVIKYSVLKLTHNVEV